MKKNWITIFTVAALMFINHSVAAKFITFTASKKGQEIIRHWGAALYGEGLYNDAKYATKYDHLGRN